MLCRKRLGFRLQLHHFSSNCCLLCYAMSQPHHINMWDGVMNHSLLSTIYIVFMVSEPVVVFSRVSSRNQHLYRCIGKGPSSITLIWPKSQLEGRIVQFFLLPTSASSISTILSASSGPIHTSVLVLPGSIYPSIFHFGTNPSYLNPYLSSISMARRVWEES